MRAYPDIFVEPDDQIECRTTDSNHPLLSINNLRLFLSATELFRIRAAINQWAAQQPAVANPVLVEGAPLDLSALAAIPQHRVDAAKAKEYGY